jgi:hypothetical protein
VDDRRSEAHRSGGIPRLDALAFEPRVVAFALAAAAVTTFVFALVRGFVHLVSIDADSMAQA